MRHLKLPLLGTILIVAASVAPVAASVPSAEVIVLQRNGDLAEIGWTATGLFADAGSWTSDFRIFGALPSPVAFATELKTTETGSAGTFRMEFQGHVAAPTGRPFSGTWMISGGTGAYSTLRGSGSWTLAVDAATGVLTFTCPGKVHFDG
jgi:hypothetical protein